MIALGVVAALLLVGMLVRVGTLPWRTERAATAALEEQLPMADALEAETAAAAEEALGAPVTLTERGYSCAMVTAESGWFVTSYLQLCSFEVTHFVRLDDGRLDQLLEEDGAGAACPRLDLDGLGDQTVIALPAGEDCEDLEPAEEDTQRVVTDAVDPADLDRSADWVQVRDERRFFDRDLGCGLTPVFCTEPMRGPVMPEA